MDQRRWDWPPVSRRLRLRPCFKQHIPGTRIPESRQLPRYLGSALLGYFASQIRNPLNLRFVSATVNRITGGLRSHTRILASLRRLRAPCWQPPEPFSSTFVRKYRCIIARDWRPHAPGPIQRAQRKIGACPEWRSDKVKPPRMRMNNKSGMETKANHKDLKDLKGVVRAGPDQHLPQRWGLSDLPERGL